VIPQTAFESTHHANSFWVWEIATQRKLHEYKSQEFGRPVEFTPDSKTLISIDGLLIRRWELATGKELPRMPGKLLAEKHEDGLITLKPLRDGKTLLTGNCHGEVFAWDLATGELLRQWKHGIAIASLQVSEDEKTLLTSSYAREAFVWDLEGLLKRR
jgi:WD40 repeat protein